MADREDQSNLPPIPDGGLGEAMPDWLRRPPAWRTLPDREVTMPEPAETAALPEADASIIDPRSFITDDDLPAWLRTFGKGARIDPAIEGEPDDVAAEGAHPSPATSERAVLAGPAAPSPGAPRFVPASPQRPTPNPAPSGARRPPERPAPPASTPSQGTGLVAVLAALLLIAIVAIVILLVT
jgi:hypothetical protein